MQGLRQSMDRKFKVGLAIILVGLVAAVTATLFLEEEPAHDPNTPWRNDYQAMDELETPPPDGYCLSEGKNDALGELLQQLAASRSRLMDKTVGGAFLPCNDAARSTADRADLPPRRFGFYAVKSRNSENPPVTSRGKPVSALSDYIADIGRLYGPEKVLGERIEKGARDAPLLGAVNLGLLGTAPYTLFTGALSDGKLAPAGTVMAEVYGASRYGDRILSVLLAAPYDGPETMDSLLATAKDAMARVEAANRDR
jgi:hypothetical protein